MKTTTFGQALTVAFLPLLALSMVLPQAALADVGITATQTVANVVGVNDQTNASSSNAVGVAQVTASRTLTVNSVPANNASTTIGSCVITYSTASADSLNCTGNTATINVTTHNATTTVASTLASLTNISGGAHGALTATSSTFTATFSTAGTETSATAINFLDGSSGAVTSSASTSGTIPVTQVNTVTLGGTVETGDKFSITIPGDGAVTYTVKTTDSSLANIATGLNAALQATTTYSSMSFTSAATSNTVVLTAKTASGTQFTFMLATINASPVAQVVTFAPPSFQGTGTGGITINSNTYSFTSGAWASLVAGLESAISSDPAATCTSDGGVITCTAKTPGTAFTYSTSFSSFTSASGGSSGGGGGGSSYHAPVVTVVPTSTAVVTPTTTTTVIGTNHTTVTAAPASGASTLKGTLKKGSINASVKVLQQILMSDPSLNYTGGVTGYFGPKTMAAVEAFQIKYNIVQAGQPGYGNVGPLTRAKLVAVYGM